MIKKQTKLYSSDNSGAKLLKCIGFFHGNKHLNGRIMETINVSIRKLKKTIIKKKIIKKTKNKAIIVSARFNKKRRGGSYATYKKNRVILVTNQNKLIGTRIKGPIDKNLHRFRNIKKQQKKQITNETKNRDIFMVAHYFS